MLKLFKRTQVDAARFCERCGRICDGICRRNAIVGRARDLSLLHGTRV